MQRGIAGMGWVGLAAALVACGGDMSTDGTRGRGNTQSLAARSGGVAGTGTSSSSGSGSFGEPIQPTRGGSGSKPVQTMDPKKCTSVTLNASRITPVVMLLVDGSSSMEQNQYPPMSGTTRWAAVRTALLDPMVGVVPMLQPLVKFGLAVYGTGGGFDIFAPPDPNKCPLPVPVVAPALNNLPGVMGGLGNAPPGTFTPTGLALNAIVDMLPDGESLDPDKEVEPQIIVLATDGNPNDCMPADFMTPNFQPSLDAATKAAAKHQKLFVISVGTDAEKTHLQQVANLGAGMAPDATPGSPVFYPENAAQLSTTLAELIGKELSCEVKLDGKGVIQGRECEGKVSIDGTMLECNGANGWRLNDPLHVELLGTACDMFKKSATSMLIANFPCEVILE